MALSVQAQTILYAVFGFIAAGLLIYYIYVAWTQKIAPARVLLFISTALLGVGTLVLLGMAIKNGVEWQQLNKQQENQTLMMQSEQNFQQTF